MAAYSLNLLEMTPNELEVAEATIERSKQTFVEVGMALMDIRDRRGYRFEYGTFEQYMEKRWAWSRDQGYKLIDAAQVFQNVETFLQNKALPSYSQAQALGSLLPDAQREVASRVDFANTAVRDLRDLVRERRSQTDERRETLRQQNAELVQQAAPLPTQTFSTIVIDPPWDWGDEGDVEQFGRGRPPYHTMPLEEIAALPVGDLAEKNAHLYLWITNRSLPKGFALLERWGFRYITALTWCKPSIGIGNYFRISTEHVLFGVKGSLPILERNAGTWFQAPRNGRHSAKPEEFYTLVERVSPGPWLDMFARSRRSGWTTWGAEA